eukprot:360479-Chlamydomonas_euryale.AAC.4
MSVHGPCMAAAAPFSMRSTPCAFFMKTAGTPRKLEPPKTRFGCMPALGVHGAKSRPRAVALPLPSPDSCMSPPRRSCPCLGPPLAADHPQAAR